MALKNTLKLEVQALDAGYGYNLVGLSVLESAPEQRTEIWEHYPTEAALQARLATLWQWWAAQVDSE